MKPEDVTLEVALKLLSLPRELGCSIPRRASRSWPTTAALGRTSSAATKPARLPAEISPLDVTLEQALELLAQPKKMRRGFGTPKEPLKVLGESPVTKQPVQLLEGRYGLYVADGETNASLPKGSSAEELTLDQALALLAVRAAAGPSKKKKFTRKKAAAPAAKKTTKKAKPPAAATDAAASTDGVVLTTKSKPKTKPKTKKAARKKKPAMDKAAANEEVA